MGKELLTLRDVSKYYTSGQQVVMGLNGVSLSFCAGEFVAITGESGSGKSTLAHVLGGFLPYESGELLLDGKPTSHYDSGDWERYRRDKISFISQNYGILPGSTVLSNVVSALRLSGMEKEEAKTEAESILRKVELWELRKRRAAKLSSGQKQRLSIARALAKPAPILLADEPTGNLDRENSEKVIALLAEAARDRLVILITHEFEEAADCATRRIALQDGRVTMDAALRELPAAPEEKREPAPARKKELSGYIAGVQLRARPVWCSIMALFFALTAFAVFAFLGTFIVNTDDSRTRLYDPTAFPNGNKTRIVAVRPDGADLTQEDFDALLSVEHVTSLERYGYVTDISYFYRENKDVFYHYNTLMTGGGFEAEPKSVERSVTLEGSGLFLKTVPLLAGEEEFLTAGRLPETMYEVVAVGDASMIGSRFPVYICDTKNWNLASYLVFTVEVVGVTDQGSHLYFSDELGRSLTSYVMQTQAAEEINGMLGVVIMPYEYDALIDERLLISAEGVVNELPDYYYYDEKNWPEGVNTVVEEGGQKLVLLGKAEWYMDEEGHMVQLAGAFDGVELPLYDGYDGEHYALELTVGNKKETVTLVRPDGTEEIVTRETDETGIGFLCAQRMYGSYAFQRMAGTEEGILYSFWGDEAVGIHGSTSYNAFTVARDAFDLLVTAGSGDQVSLFMEDYAFAERVLEQVRALGYIAVSPYANGATVISEELAAERMQTLEICLLALAAVVLLQIVVLRALFSVETENYSLLANLGLRRRAARRSVLWQVLLFALIGEVMAASAVAVCGHLEVERVVTLLQYLPVPYAVLTWAVHVALSLIAVLWIGSALSRQVYPATGTKSDLDLSSVEEEVGA